MFSKHKPLIIYISLIFLISLFAIGCTQELQTPIETQIEKSREKNAKDEIKNVPMDMDGGEAKVVVGLHMPWDDGKALSSNHNTSYDYFLLTTQYLSDRRDGSTITGEYTDLKLAANGNGGRDNVDLGYFTQGKWRFSVKATNSDGDVLYLGSWIGYIAAGNNNSILISMEENSEAVGYLSFDVASITVPLPRIVVSYTKVWNGDSEHLLLDTSSDARGLEMTTNKNGYTFYKTPPIALPTGAYWLKVQLWSDTNLFSGEVLDTYIVPKKTTDITGVFTITGLLNFIRVQPEETLMFTDACAQIEIDTGKLITGFNRLGFEDPVTFPYTNETDEIQYLMPIFDDVTKYFTISGGVLSGTGYPYKYVGFNHGYFDSPREISANIFANSKLESIYSPETVRIGANAFSNTKLRDTVFGTIENIGDYAFKNSTISDLSTSRTSNTINIGRGAFDNSSLKYFDVPSGASVGEGAFSNCHEFYRGSFVAPNIPNNCFNGNKKLAFMNLDGVVKIGDGAFNGCVALEELTLPDTVTAIGANAFNGCLLLKNTFVISAAVKTIGKDAFKGMTGLKEIYLNAICGDIEGEPWSAPCSITWWGYKLYLDSNLPSDYTRAPGEEEFPMITEKNGIKLEFPIADPKYRIIAYNDVIGATLDGYSIPIPVIDGYALRGWFTERADGTEITQLTVNTRKDNWTVYAHWVRGLLTVIFSGGRGGDSNMGIPTESYRMVRYQGLYGRVGEEDEIDDFDKALPTAKIEGRDFIGWYSVPEPMLDDVSPDETTQKTMGAKRVVESTQVTNKKSHTLFPHYIDHRYTVQFDANLPTNAQAYGTRDGKNVYYSYKVPASYTVVYNQPYSKAWGDGKLSSKTYRGDDRKLPDLNKDGYQLDNYYFVGWYLEPECTTRVFDATKVAAQETNGKTINLYAKWIGKEKQVNYYSRYKELPTSTSYTQKTVKTVKHRFTAPHGSTDARRRFFNTVVLSGFEKELEKDVPFQLPMINADNNASFNLAGYTFNGWYTGYDDATGKATGSQVIDGATFGGDKTEVDAPKAQNLYAKWTPNTYIVTFDPQGGSVNTISKKVTFHSTYGEGRELPVPVREGYIFTGWYNTPTRSGGYGYQNSPAHTLKDSYVLISADHTLYAAWSAVAVVDSSGETTTPLNTSLTFNPTANGGYYGQGQNNVASQVVNIKTVKTMSTNGVMVNGKWVDAGKPTPEPNHKVTITCNANGYLSAETTIVTDANGAGVINVATTQKAGPGTSNVILKTSTPGEVQNGVINVKLTGRLSGISLTASPDSIVVRNKSTITASLTSDEGNLHASNCGIDWQISTLPDNYTKIATGANAGTGAAWAGANQKINTAGVTSQITLWAGYTDVVGDKRPTITATGTLSGTSKTIRIAITVPEQFIKLTKGERQGSFFTNVEHVYGKNAKAKAQWLITGFREWEGGNPDEPSSDSANSHSEGWVNGTDHSVYLVPITTKAYTTNGANAKELGNKSNIAFPTNVTKIGKFIDTTATDVNYSDTRMATKIYIAGYNVIVGQYAFANNNNDCEFKIAGSITDIRAYAFKNSIGIWGITVENFKQMQKIGAGAFQGALNETKSQSVNLSSCTTLGEYAFYKSKVETVSTRITSKYAFAECPRLTTVTCSAPTIELGAFTQNPKLNSVTLENTQTIRQKAFYLCQALTLVDFPSTLSIIENATSESENCGAFESSGIKSVNLARSYNLNRIGYYAFYNCKSLTTVYFPDSLVSIGTGAFRYSSLQGVLETKKNTTSIEDSAFRDCTGLTSVIINANGVSVGASSFENCTNVQSVKFGSVSAITLGARAFAECTSLDTVDFLAMKSNFNTSTFEGKEIWSNCKLQYVKLDKSCFSSASRVEVTVNSRSNKWFKAPVVYFYARSSCGWWLAHPGGCNTGAVAGYCDYGYSNKDKTWKYNAGDGTSWSRNRNNGASWDITCYGFGIKGYCDGWHRGGWESSGESCFYWELNTPEAATVWEKIVEHGYKFAGGSNASSLNEAYPEDLCNDYVYPGMPKEWLRAIW